MSLFQVYVQITYHLKLHFSAKFHSWLESYLYMTWVCHVHSMYVWWTCPYVNCKRPAHAFVQVACTWPVCVLQKQQERTPKDKLSKSESRALHEELMSCKLRTAETDTTNKQLRLRVMELETSGQITANQVIVVLSMLCRSCFCYMVLRVQPINKVIAVVVSIICNLGNLDAAALCTSVANHYCPYRHATCCWCR